MSFLKRFSKPPYADRPNVPLPEMRQGPFYAIFGPTYSEQYPKGMGTYTLFHKNHPEPMAWCFPAGVVQGTPNCSKVSIGPREVRDMELLFTRIHKELLKVYDVKGKALNDFLFPTNIDPVPAGYYYYCVFGVMPVKDFANVDFLLTVVAKDSKHASDTAREILQADAVITAVSWIKTEFVPDPFTVLKQSK